MDDLQMVVVYKRPDDVSNTNIEDVAESIVKAIWAILPSSLSTINYSSEEKELWQQWNSGNIRKIMKHAKAKDFYKIIENEKIVSTQDASANLDRIGFHCTFSPMNKNEDVEFIIFIPATKDQMIKSVKKLQLDNFPKIERRSSIHLYHEPYVSIAANKNLGISLPKGLMAIAHAAQRITPVLEQDKDFEAWKSNGMPFSSSFLQLNVDLINESTPQGSVIIKDAGFTEVEPGSVTAFGIFMK